MKKHGSTLFSLSLGKIMVASMFGNLEAAKLSDVINNASIDGFAFGRINAVDGRDGEGVRYQFRFKPTITSGAIYGVSASAGIFFSKGSATPDNNSTENDIGGSRGQTIDSLVDRFNIGDFYITLDGKETLHTKSVVRLGQRSPGTPFNDNNLDRALGVFAENTDISAMNFGFQWWDSWMGDDIYISLPGIDSKGAGIGNNVFMVYVKSGADFTKETRLSYNLWYAGIHRWVNAMVFGDIAYSTNFGNQNLTFTGQVSYTSMANQPYIYSGSVNLRGLFGGHNAGGVLPNGQQDWYAKDRGMYNIRVDYKYNFTQASDEEGGAGKVVGFFGASAGFAGSFGDGYGTIIDNTGGLKLGGHLWNSYAGTEANGFGILGVGGFKNSSIIVPYVRAEMGYKKFSTALDVAYIDTSHFFYLQKGSRGENLNKTRLLYNNANFVKAVSFFDVALSATYKFTSSINMFAAYGYALGNPQFGRFRFQVNYVF